MNAGDWIAEAREHYEARPWISWSLRFGAALDADLTLLRNAAHAAAQGANAMTRENVRAELAAIEKEGESGRRFAERVRIGLRPEGRQR